MKKHEKLQWDVITWLGKWRDDLPPKAISQLQDICEVPKKLENGNPGL